MQEAVLSKTETEEPLLYRLKSAVLFLVAFSLPFDRFYSTVLLYTLAALTIVDLHRVNFRRIPKLFWVFQAAYLLGVAGYFYSYNKAGASSLLGRQTAMLLFPVILPLTMPVTERAVRLALSGLALSCVITAAYLITHLWWVIRSDLGVSFVDGLSNPAFYNHGFSRPIGIHAGYLSLFMATSMAYYIWRFPEAGKRARAAMVGAVLLIQVALLFLASRNTLIALLVVFLLIYPFYAFRYRWKIAVITLVGFGALLIAIMRVPYLRERFSRQFMTDIGTAAAGTEITYGGAEPRIERWRAGWTLAGRSPWFGYGTGDEIPMLKTEYIKRKLYVSYIEELNAHNQYLSYLLKNGIVGLVLFCGAFAFYVVIALRTRYFMYVAFLVLILIGFYTENILDANKGIFFFAIFNTLFGYNALRKLRELRQQKPLISV